MLVQAIDIIHGIRKSYGRRKIVSHSQAPWRSSVCALRDQPVAVSRRQSLLHHPARAAKRLRPSDYTNLIPITSPFFQATLQALPGEVRLDRIVERTVFIRGANRPFGGLTLEDARAHADELRAATGWGPTVRVAPVAQAWRELALAMERTGSRTVSELEGGVVVELAPRLWVMLPGGPMMS